MDPDGRPTVLTENALTIPVPDANKFPLPGPQQDPKGFPYRSSWSMQDGIWKKLEDRVAWSEVGARNIATYGRPVERLVTSFSPDQDKGLQSTAETQRGMKRDADQSGLPPREGRPPNMSDAAQPSASVYPPAENLNMQKPFQFTVKNAIVPINDKIWNFPNAQGAVRTPSSQILAK